jgi:hypothetical protein
MTVFTVHEPRPRRNETAAAPERFVFVRDGFYFWAFLLGPLWMLWHRLWLVLVIYLVATTAVQALLWALAVSPVVKFAAGALIALLVGFEAASLRRWTLGRRRWRNVGLVVGRNVEAAERRFFDSWVANHSARVAPPPPADAPVPPPAESSVIGLFPEPQPRP